MSPQSVAQGQSPEEIYEWVHIDDFSPGCWSNTFASATNPADLTLSAPLGAANPEKTYACAALPGGGLGPLPGRFADLPFSDGSFPGTSTVAVITGLAVTPGLSDGHDELVVLLEADDATHHYVQGWSLYWPGILNTFHAITGVTHTSATTPGFFGAPYPAWTRMNVSGSVTPGTPGPPPVLVFPGSVVTDANGINGHLWVYPPLLSPSAFTAQDLIVAASSVTGQVIAYGSRIICLVGNTYTHPIGTGINTNENLNFTDPPNSSSYGAQYTWLTSEIPWGYGAWGSVSVGELLLVKKHGGALIMYGDVDAPTSVIEVPGVESTGDFVGRAAATPSGLVYASQNRGAWVWNGGNTAQKISRQLDDSFFDLETNVIGSNNYGFYAEHWQGWVLMSGNWLYNPDSNSWWILYPKHAQTPSTLTGADFFWFVPGRQGNQVYAAPLVLNKGASGNEWFFLFDSEIPSSEWSWQSVPIHVTKNADSVLDVRQLVIRASAPDGNTSNHITATIGSWTETSTSTIGIEPTILRFDVGAIGLSDIELTLLAINNSGDSAPIIHSIDIGYQVRSKKAVEV